MKNVKVTITGLDGLKAKLRAMSTEVNAAAEKQLGIVCEDLRLKAVDLAPKDTGDLRGSSYAEVKGLDGEVGFAEPYATRQHEELEYQHKYGQAKYLEQPYEGNRDKYIALIKNAVKEVVVK